MTVHVSLLQFGVQVQYSSTSVVLIMSNRAEGLEPCHENRRHYRCSVRQIRQILDRRVLRTIDHLIVADITALNGSFFVR